MEKKLVVLPYRETGSQGDEIKLALSCWKKFCQFDYHFVVIGEFNNQLKKEFPWVEFIYCSFPEQNDKQYMPHIDIQRKMKVVMEKYRGKYDGFVYMSDDKYAIKPFNLKDITTVFYKGHSFNGNKNNPACYWAHDRWKTRQLLDAENLPHVDYTTHYPYYFEFSKIDEIWTKFNMLNESYALEDVYFNYFPHEKPIPVSNILLRIWYRPIFDKEFNKAIENPDIKFVSNSVEGWSKELENELWKIVS